MTIPIQAFVLVALVVGSMGTLTQAKTLTALLGTESSAGVSTEAADQSAPASQASAGAAITTVTAAQVQAVSDEPVRDVATDASIDKPVDRALIDIGQQLLVDTMIPVTVDIEKDFADLATRDKAMGTLTDYDAHVAQMSGPMELRVMWDHVGKNWIYLTIDSKGRFIAHHYVEKNGVLVEGVKQKVWGRMNGNVYFGFVGVANAQNFFWGRFWSAPQVWKMQNFHNGLMIGEYRNFPEA